MCEWASRRAPLIGVKCNYTLVGTFNLLKMFLLNITFDDRMFLMMPAQCHFLSSVHVIFTIYRIVPVLDLSSNYQILSIESFLKVS